MLLSGGPGSPQQVTVPGECAGASACALLHAIVPLTVKEQQQLHN